MGKNEKTKLGRALVKHHNQMVQQTKEKGQFYRNQQKRVLESVTDVNDIDAVIDHAEEAERLFSVENPVPNLLIDVDAAASPDMTPEERRKQQKMEEALYASSLQVPRRPPWKVPIGEQGPAWKILPPEEVDINERRSFLMWRRNLARLEENEKLVLTPFEKNLDIWRQLWRVLERSDLLVMVVDARDPLFYRCPDLEVYAREIDRHKKTLLLVNKADLLPLSVREKWAEYFHQHGISFAFWSAKAASAALEGKNLSGFLEKQTTSDRADYTDTKIYGRDELLARLQAEAEAIASTRRDIRANHAETGSDGSTAVPSKHAVVGFVGYPNVGKSSTINALVGEKRAGVTSTPGKTKHFQTLIISDELMLCDCPGLVFPSFSSSRYEMIASGVLPIDRMTEHREAIQVVANKVPRHAIETIYNITLPKPKPYELQSRPPSASELLRAFCASRGYVASSGLPDETRAARLILKDYIDGKLPHFEMPNVTSDGDTKDLDAAEPSHSADYESDSSEAEDPPDEESNINQEQVLDDLRSFDLSNGLAPTKAVVVNKKPSAASHKHHKKPQKKKDRSWRVRNDDGDGMPVVRVFQKTVNAGPLSIG